MRTVIRSPRHTAMFISFGIFAGFVILANAPAEQTLGRGINSIYVHVAFIWTGLTGLLLSAVMGLFVLISKSRRIQSLAQTVTLIATLAFGIGILLSLIAADVNWGAVFYVEPRLQASANVVAIAIVVLVLAGWIPNIRIRGFLYLLPMIFLVQSIFFTRLVLHPPTPTVSVSATPIQFTFYALFGICMACCVWLVAFIQIHRPSR